MFFLVFKCQERYLQKVYHVYHTVSLTKITGVACTIISFSNFVIIIIKQNDVTFIIQKILHSLF